jgi:hypothetical protein
MAIITLPDGRKIDTDRIAQQRAANPLNAQFLQDTGFNQPGGPVGPNQQLLESLAGVTGPRREALSLGAGFAPTPGFTGAVNQVPGAVPTGSLQGQIASDLQGIPGITPPPGGSVGQGGVAGTGQLTTGGAQDNTQLINQTFQDVLGRAPSAEVVQFYQQQLAAGLSPQEFLGQIQNSPEALQNQGIISAGAPPTGLIGGEQALLTGLEASIGGLEEGITQGVSAIQGGTEQALQQLATGQQPLQQFADPGIQAQQQQAALSGALGPEAQQAAFAEFSASPGQQFLQQEAERALLRNQAAIGGLGGGNVRRALQEQAVGLGQQFFQQGFENLGQVAGRGLEGAQGLAQLAGQGAGFAQQGGLAQGQLLGQAGVTAADIALTTGQNIAQQRFQTGRDIANAVSGTTSALSGLAETQGAGLADITGQAGANIANLLSGFGQLDAASQQALGVLLSNLATQQGTQGAILQGQIGQAEAGAITGQASGLREGIGQAAGATSAFQTGGLTGLLESFIPPAPVPVTVT